MEFLPRVIHTFHSYGRKETDKKNMLEKHEVVDPVNLKKPKAAERYKFTAKHGTCFKLSKFVTSTL